MNEQFGSKMNEDVNENRKLLRKEENNVKWGEMQKNKGLELKDSTRRA